MVVIGTGTGGTLTGVGKKLKEKVPGVKVIGVDPIGSKIAGTDDNDHFFEVEGMGYDFVPTTLDMTLVDSWVIFVGIVCGYCIFSGKNRR